jgi:predicted enzyme related to lactoylglutathione lyase
MFTHVLAVAPVSDISVSREWYEKLFGRDPDNTPMDSLIEWQVTDHGWLQVSDGLSPAGSAAVNLAVDDLAGHLAEVAGRGISHGPIVPVNKGVELCMIKDPDGNTITFVGNFRVKY